MKLPIAAALSFSLVLVGISGAVRINNDKNSKESAEILTQIIEGDSGYDFATLESNTVVAQSTSTEKLSTTDLIGRQLILDYVDLATRGEATDKNLNELAETYAERIPSLNYSKSINFSDLKSVSNTKVNLQTYATQFTNIYKSYAERVSKANSTSKDTSTLGPGLYTLAGNLSKIYLDTATQLQNIPAPLVLIENHLKITNVYLSNSAAMKAISETEKDSSAAFAGMVTINSNAEVESAILDSITDILTKNGI
mgnify:CR=1 FL=1